MNDKSKEGFVSIAGLRVNDTGICIKERGSTFACVCKECSENRHNKTMKYLSNYE